ncbi:MAG: hypothetical protein V7744_20750 [Pseudomonadales bacterium]
MIDFSLESLSVMEIKELASALGVLASVIYFATQMRINAAETRDATTYSIMELAINFRAESYKGELAEIRMKANKGEPLTPLESVKFEGYLSALFELTELVFMAHRKGKIDLEYMNAWELRIKAAMSVSRIRTFWSNTKRGYRPSFISYVEELID